VFLDHRRNAIEDRKEADFERRFGRRTDDAEVDGPVGSAGAEFDDTEASDDETGVDA
jgi:hypothetical protein